MIINFIYEIEYTKVIPAIIMDSRFTIPDIKNQDGWAAKAYIDKELSMIIAGILPYRLETDNGNIAGYMTLDATKPAVSVQKLQLRPAFQQFLTSIQQQITNFIQTNAYQYDYL